MSECQQCDFEHPINPIRATWLCPKCGRDYSLEYLFWYEAAHQEEFDKKDGCHPLTVNLGDVL
jgi:transposase-like protein